MTRVSPVRCNTHVSDFLIPFDEIENEMPVRLLVDWYPLRRCPNVLWLHFEDLKTDLRQCVKLIASFMGIDPHDEARIDCAMRQVC